MKLYVLSQNVNNRYDTYDSILVAAESPEDAKTIDPYDKPFEDKGEYTSWVHSMDDIKVVEIGIANDGAVRGVIMTSFNAG